MALQLLPGERTSAVLAKPPQETKKILLLVHGFMSNKDSETNLTLTKRFLEKGVATIRFDLFGHGESDGLFQQLTLSNCLRQVEGILEWIKKSGYTKIGLVGSSFGGLIAIETACNHLDLICLALKCPVSNYPAIWQNRLGEVGMAEWKREGLLSFVTEDGKARLEYRYYEDLLKYDTYRNATRIQTPTLIVHGDTDDDVPVDQSIRLFDILRLRNDQKQLVLIPGADHAFSKPEDFEKMIHQMEGFLAQSL